VRIGVQGSHSGVQSRISSALSPGKAIQGSRRGPRIIVAPRRSGAPALRIVRVELSWWRGSIGGLNSSTHLLYFRTGIYSDAQNHSSQVWEIISRQPGAKEGKDINEKTCSDARHCGVS